MAGEEEPEATEMDTLFCEDETVCPICQAEFIDIDDLQEHVRQFHQGESQETGPVYQKNHLCRLCFEYFSSALDLALHIRDSHIINIKTCTFCIRAFLTRQELWQHEEKHNLSVSSMFACSECPMLFEDLTELEYHELNSHSEAPGMMLQPYYPELSSVLRLHADRFMQHINKKTTFICTCMYTTSDIMLYVKHVQTEKCNVYVCNTCNKVFTSRKRIMEHARKVTCERVKNCNIIKCPNCYKAVAQKDVKYHKRCCKAVRCTKCNLSFNTVYDLANHQEKHSKKSVIVKECRYCAKSLVGLEIFKQHVIVKHRINYLKYKYNCVYCKKIFDHPQSLFTHFLSRHRTLRPFVCNICNQTFMIRSRFTYHIKLNHESKGFVEFTKDLNVHFNAVKSPKAVTLTPPASLFTPEEEEEFKSNGIDIKYIQTKTASSSNVHKGAIPIKKAHSIKGDNKNAIPNKNDSNDDSSTANPKSTEVLIELEEIKETKQPEESDQPGESEQPVQSKDDFESSDDEPIKIKKRRKGAYSRKLICNICKQKCYTIDNYNRHMNGHKSNKGLKQCLKCDKKFKTSGTLMSHIQLRHTTSLIKSLRTMVAKRKQTPQAQVPFWRKEKFICNIEKVFIPQDYRPTAEIKLHDKTKPIAQNEPGVDKVLLKILSDVRAAAKKRPQIVIKKCVFDEIIQLPKKGIKMQKCEISENPTNYEPAKILPHIGPVEKSKVDFGLSNLISTNSPEEGYYYEDDVINFEDVVTNNDDTHSDHGEMYNETITTETKPIKSELIPSVEKNNITDASALLVPNEQTKKFGKLNVATMYYTETGQVAYKIVPFKLANDDSEIDNEEEIDQPQEMPGGPKLVQTNPLAHLMGSIQLATPAANKYYKKKVQNPQLKIAQALMELKKPNKYKERIRVSVRPPKRQSKTERPENSDTFKYEILDDEAENWVMVSEEKVTTDFSIV